MSEFLNTRNAVIGSVALLATTILFLIDNTPKKIIKTASKYLGIKEIGDDAGFDNEEFEQRLKLLGWRAGSDWCAFFVKLVMLEVFRYNLIKHAVLNKIMSGSTQITFHNFQKHSGFWKSTNLPSPGSIVNWQKVGSEDNNYPRGRGHFGIVYKVDGQNFYTIEGNQKQSVSLMQHNLNEFSKTAIGQMRLMGFINLF